MKKVVVMLPVQQRHMDLFRQQVSAFPEPMNLFFSHGRILWKPYLRR